MFTIKSKMKMKKILAVSTLALGVSGGLTQSANAGVPVTSFDGIMRQILHSTGLMDIGTGVVGQMSQVATHLENLQSAFQEKMSDSIKSMEKMVASKRSELMTKAIERGAAKTNNISETCKSMVENMQAGQMISSPATYGSAEILRRAEMSKQRGDRSLDPVGDQRKLEAKFCTDEEVKYNINGCESIKVDSNRAGRHLNPSSLNGTYITPSMKAFSLTGKVPSESGNKQNSKKQTINTVPDGSVVQIDTIVDKIGSHNVGGIEAAYAFRNSLQTPNQPINITNAKTNGEDSGQNYNAIYNAYSNRVNLALKPLDEDISSALPYNKEPAGWKSLLEKAETAIEADKFAMLKALQAPSKKDLFNVLVAREFSMNTLQDQQFETDGSSTARREALMIALLHQQQKELEKVNSLLSLIALQMLDPIQKADVMNSYNNSSRGFKVGE